MILCKFYYIILRQKYSLVLFIFNVVHGNICSVFVSLTFTVVQLTSFCRRPGKRLISYVQGVKKKYKCIGSTKPCVYLHLYTPSLCRGKHNKKMDKLRR